MSKRLDEVIGVMEYDGLLISGTPVADVVTVELAASETVVKRGTVLMGTPGEKDFAALAAGADVEKALYILADDVDTADSPTGTAYRTGHFARSKLITAEGYTLSPADEEILRKSGILISDAIEY